MHFSRCYNEEWVEKLYRGFKRNLTIPFEFVVFTDKHRKFSPHIKQERLWRLPADYGSCIEPFRLGEPMIFVGLDTIILGNVDKFARWCLSTDKIALPKHPYEDFSINGVVLCPKGQEHIHSTWNGENDMKWLREFPHDRIDELWPKRVVSYKAHVAKRGTPPPEAKIVYFHGSPKAHDLIYGHKWVQEHWR